MAGFKVLLVDDLKLSIEMERSAFDRIDCEILSAGSGEEALEISRREHPDIVILDLFMPGMNGDECCSIIKEDPLLKKIPVIMTTAGRDEKDRERCFSAGCDDFIVKPFNATELLKKVARFIDIVVRDYARVPEFLEVVFAAGGKVHKGYLQDLSEKGAFVKSDAILPVGETIILVFTMPDKSATVEAEAKIMRVVEKSIKFNPDINVGMGVRFINLTNEAEKFINDYLKKSQSIKGL